MLVCLALLGLACSRVPGREASSFAGQTIRLIVARPPGGSYDLQARLFARHFGRHVPGQPAVVVENMPGASGLAAAVHLATRAPLDGTTLGFLGPDLVLGQLNDRRKPGIELSAIAFVGSPSAVDRLCVFSPRSGISDVASWKAASSPPRLGASARGGLSYVTAMVLQEVLGLPIQVIQGYAGSAEIRLAIESGEIDGTCSGGEGFEVFGQAGDGLVPVLRATPDPPESLAHVPDALDVAQSDRARELIRVGLYDVSKLSRFVAARAGTSPERLDLLRKALMATFDDAELRREAARAGIKVAPIASGELEAAAGRLLGGGAGGELLRRVVVPR